MLATASAQVCVPLGHSSLYFIFIKLFLFLSFSFGWVVTSVSVVHELLQVRWNRMCLQLLSSPELDFIVDALCTGQA